MVHGGYIYCEWGLNYVGFAMVCKLYGKNRDLASENMFLYCIHGQCINMFRPKQLRYCLLLSFQSHRIHVCHIW